MQYKEPSVTSSEIYSPTLQPYSPTSEPYVPTSEPKILTDESQNALPIQAPSSLTRTQEFMNDYWVYEIIACIISLGTLAAIFGVLHTYNGTDLDSWSHSWSLGSLVGLLATISQVSMAVPLGSSISQLKWVWFLGSFGALITILAIAFHTLIQNAISAESGSVPYLDDSAESGALFPQGNNYSSYNDYSSGAQLGDQGPALDMVADLNYGMFYTAMDADTQVQQSVATCWTGNCTWDHIQTLSVCSQCADISSAIGRDNGFYTLYSITLDMPEDIGLVTSLGDTVYPDPSTLPDVGPLIVHLTTMARHTVDEEPIGIDCALYWCVLDKSEVVMTNWNITNAVSTTWTDTSESAKTTYLQDTDITLTPPTCYDESGNNDPDTTQCTKTVSAEAQLGIQNFLRSGNYGFTGTATQNTTTGGWDISSEFIQLLYSTTGTSSDFLGSLELFMGNIGFMMTSNIRQATPQTGFANSVGQVNVWVTLIHIRWGFLILPIVLVVATILFMSVTIFQSRGQEKWKSSLLPLLFHPLVERPAVVPHKLSEINALAQTKEVRLEKGHAGSQFV